MDIDPLDFQGMLQAACDAYCTMYYNKYGTHPSTGKDCTHKAYKTIVKLCLDHGIEINDYIATCFYLVEKERRYITPADFAKLDFIDRYEAHRKRSKPTLAEYDYEEQRKSLHVLLTVSKALYPTEESALINVGTPFASWFRVLYPATFNEKLFKYYGQLAWKDLQADKALRVFLRKIRGAQVAELEKRIAYFGDTEDHGN